MEKNRREQIKQHIDTFPVLPSNVAALMRVTNDPESSIQDLIEVILPDQSLCISVLKIANSALFGFPKKVESINRAVTILGFNEVERIALTKALMNSFNKLSRKHKSDMDKFWEHSFICGLLAKVIAKDLDMPGDIAFIGGIIHDIGKLVMLETFEEDYTTDYWMRQLSTLESRQKELHMFAFTHDQVGGDLLEKWLFPESLISAVGFHHRPAEAPANVKIACIIQLADALSFYYAHPELLENDDIVETVYKVLPDFETNRLELSDSLEDQKIISWFGWLHENYEKGSNIKEAFML